MTDDTDPDDILEGLGETYRRKNREYGSSWRLAGETLARWCDEQGVEELPTDEATMISLGLYFQRLHKLTRGFNGEFALDELDYESVGDSHEDEIVYGSMHATLFTED